MKNKNARLLMQHVEKMSKEVRATWPRWKQVIFMPRRPRNGFNQ